MFDLISSSSDFSSIDMGELGEMNYEMINICLTNLPSHLPSHLIADLHFLTTLLKVTNSELTSQVR